MPRPRNVAPSYVRHAKTGRGRLIWYDATGTRREKLLPGLYGSAESLAAKAAAELEIASSPLRTPTVTGGAAPAALTVAELLLAYLDHAEGHYRTPGGKPTSEIYEVRVVVRALRELYATLPVTDFGPLKLKAARAKWVEEGRARVECNRRAGIVKRIFKWATSEELVPPAVYQGLTAVTGLKAGRTAAREMPPVGPVDDATVDATLPHLSRHVRGLVEFQRLTGARPGEACMLRRCDIDTGGSVWLYTPVTHKTAHHGKGRVIAIGPRAQGVLRGYFPPCASDYVFSPARAAEEHHAARSAERKTPKYASHMARNAAKRKAAPKRAPKERYDRTSYSRAIARACERAKVTHWHPNQLRHTFATAVRKAHGLEAAQVLLGHSRADVTQVYAERDTALAAAVAAKIG